LQTEFKQMAESRDREFRKHVNTTIKSWLREGVYVCVPHKYLKACEFSPPPDGIEAQIASEYDAMLKHPRFKNDSATMAAFTAFQSVRQSVGQATDATELKNLLQSTLTGGPFMEKWDDLRRKQDPQFAIQIIDLDAKSKALAMAYESTTDACFKAVSFHQGVPTDVDLAFESKCDAKCNKDPVCILRQADEFARSNQVFFDLHKELEPDDTKANEITALYQQFKNSEFGLDEAAAFEAARKIRDDPLLDVLKGEQTKTIDEVKIVTDLPYSCSSTSLAIIEFCQLCTANQNVCKPDDYEAKLEQFYERVKSKQDLYDSVRTQFEEFEAAQAKFMTLYRDLLMGSVRRLVAQIQNQSKFNLDLYRQLTNVVHQITETILTEMKLDKKDMHEKQDALNIAILNPRCENRRHITQSDRMQNHLWVGAFLAKTAVLCVEDIKRACSSTGCFH
jgi:hypothetical protein